MVFIGFCEVRLGGLFWLKISFCPRAQYKEGPMWKKPKMRGIFLHKKPKMIGIFLHKINRILESV